MSYQYHLDILDHRKQLIQSGRFSEIQTGDYKISTLTMIVKEASPFTDEAYHLCNTLFPDWLDRIYKLPFNYSTLEYLVKNQILCINGYRFNSLIYVILKRDDWKDLMDMLFEYGADPNNQENLGGSLLKKFLWLSIDYISYQYRAAYDPDPDNCYSRVLTILPYLLEHEADPLLEDKKGVSSLEMLLKIKEQNKDERLRVWYDQILNLLQAYA